jgi:uncharacterized lipoprotein YmbA
MNFNPTHVMKNHPGSGPALLSLLACFLAAGCSSLLPIQPPKEDATRYYMLSASELVGSVPAAPPPRLVVRGVEVPAYLLNKPFVTRLGPNELKFIDDVRWAEPLDAGIERALRVRLAALTGHYGLEARGTAHDYEVVVRVTHCEGASRDGKGTVRFAAEFELLKPGPAAEMAAHASFTAKEAAWDGKDYAALAQLLSRAVADLGDAVLAAVPEKK